MYGYTLIGNPITRDGGRTVTTLIACSREVALHPIFVSRLVACQATSIRHESLRTAGQMPPRVISGPEVFANDSAGFGAKLSLATTKGEDLMKRQETKATTNTPSD